MRILLRLFLLVVVVIGAAATVSVAKGFYDATQAAGDLDARAARLKGAGAGVEALGQDHFAKLLAVQDPGFATHSGVDLASDGAGITTMTQSLAKRVAFEDFQPGWAKLRQTGYALGLERHLDKDAIATLWLDTVEMGRHDGAWRTGFFDASEAGYGKAPSEMTDTEYADMVALLIAPGRLTRAEGLDERADRRARILALWSGACTPSDVGDVWLDGCAAAAQ